MEDKDEEILRTQLEELSEKIENMEKLVLEYDKFLNLFLKLIICRGVDDERV